MKFSSSLALLGLLGGTAALIPSKKLNTKTLLKNARRLDGEEEEQWEPTSDYSIQFSQCLSLKVNSEDVFDEDLYQYTYEGQIVAQQSYVLFNVCQTEYCGYYDESNIYMTPLGDYMDAVMEYRKQTKERLCEACEETCWQEDEEEEEGDEEEEEEGDEEDEDDEDDEDRRKLAKKKRKLANYVDCDVCDSIEGCDDEEDEGDDDGDEANDVYEWLEGMAECQETGSQWNDQDLYAGFICNSAGDGVELAVFLDEDCSIYTTQQAYSSIMSNSDEAFLDESKDIIINAFKNDVSCEDFEYDDPNEEQDYDDEDDEEDEVNEFCKKVFDDDTRAIDNCGDYDDEEEEDEEEDYDENQVNYDWYEFDLDEEDAEDAYAVCTTIAGFEGEYSNAHVYLDGEEFSGSLYDYHEGEKKSSGGIAGKVFLILLLIALVLVGAFFVAQHLKKKKETDSKKEPLTKKGGAMA